MGGAISKVAKEIKKGAGDALDVTSGKWLKDASKKGWDDARGATKKKEAKREAERIAAIPEAEATTGEQDTQSLLQRRGRKATRLGGRSLLG